MVCLRNNYDCLQLVYSGLILLRVPNISNGMVRFATGTYHNFPISRALAVNSLKLKKIGMESLLRKAVNRELA